MNELFMPLPYTGKMFKDDMLMQYVVPLIESYDDSICHKGYDYPGLSINLKYLYCEYNIKIFQKYLYKTFGSINTKMLMEMAKHPCSYHEIYNIFLKPRGKPFGNDSTLFKSLNANGLCKIHSIGKYKRKFYVPSDFGNLVLDIAKKNDVAYKVLRHYMKDVDDFEAYAISVDINPETMDDLNPKTFIQMLDAIFNEDSDLHKIGSYAYWGEKLVSCIKNNKNCFNMTNDPEVKVWLSSNMSNPSVACFSKTLSRIAKKKCKICSSCMKFIELKKQNTTIKEIKTMQNQFNHTWKVYFKRGGGQAVVYGNTEQEAKAAALAFWRKQKSMMDNCTTKEIIKHLEPIS